MAINPVTWHTSRVVKINRETDSKSNGTHHVTEHAVDVHCSGSLVEPNRQKRQSYDLWCMDVDVTSRQGIQNGSQELDKRYFCRGTFTDYILTSLQ